MGRHGRTGLARLLMGSVTARIIGLSPVKLLVVPRGATLTFKRLLVASDGSPYSAAAWDQAFSLARHLNSELLAVCVAREEGEITMAQEILDNLMNAANREGVRLQALMPQGQPADDGIIQAVLRNNVNLIIMGSHGRTGLARLLMGSVTERVVGHSPCPVLVVKRGEE
jgi:nucleotide-binding universal stress UspA family protein